MLEVDDVDEMKQGNGGNNEEGKHVRKKNQVNNERHRRVQTTSTCSVYRCNEHWTGEEDRKTRVIARRFTHAGSKIGSVTGMRNKS